MQQGKPPHLLGQNQKYPRQFKQATPAAPPPSQAQAGTSPTTTPVNHVPLPDIILLIQALGPGIDWGVALSHMEITQQIRPLFQTPIPPTTTAQTSVPPPQPTQTQTPILPSNPTTSSSKTTKPVKPTSSATKPSKTPKTTINPTVKSTLASTSNRPKATKKPDPIPESAKTPKPSSSIAKPTLTPRKQTQLAKAVTQLTQTTPATQTAHLSETGKIWRDVLKLGINPEPEVVGGVKKAEELVEKVTNFRTRGVKPQQRQEMGNVAKG